MYRNSFKSKVFDSVIHLMGNKQIKEFKIYKKSIQHFPKNRYNTIRILVGYISDEMVMVFDNNHNEDFSDDSVYTYDSQKRKMTNQEFRNSLPAIQMDSLEIIDSSNKPNYFSTKSRFCPTLKNDKSYSNYYETPKSDALGLLVFSDSCYTTENFKINNESYFIELIPHTFIFPVYPLPNSDFSRATIALIKRINNDSSVMVGSSIIELMLAKNKEISFGDFFLQVKNYNFFSKEIEFTVSKYSNFKKETLKFLSSHLSYSLKHKKYKPIDLSSEKYNVIEFGGSWCKPCVGMIPELNQFFQDQNDKINLVSILKESNVSAAIKYYKKTKQQWDVYFEPIQCSKKNCLTSFFDVGIYPTVFLLNTKGEILFRANGSGSIKNLEAFFKKIL